MGKFQFVNTVIKQYSQYKGISEQDTIDLFNKYRIFNYLWEYSDWLQKDSQLFWKIDIKINYEKEELANFDVDFYSTVGTQDNNK